jgi:hypothetical protein
MRVVVDPEPNGATRGFGEEPSHVLGVHHGHILPMNFKGGTEASCKRPSRLLN